MGFLAGPAHRADKLCPCVLLLKWKWGTSESWDTSPTRPGKEIRVFTCNPGDAGWGPKCNHLVVKLACERRRISGCHWFRQPTTDSRKYVCVRRLSLSTHMNKELSFVPMKLLFASMSLLQTKLSLIPLMSGLTIRLHAYIVASTVNFISVLAVVEV